MTQAEVAERVSRIDRISHDDVLARNEMRRLWEEVLVEAAEDGNVLAQTALRARNYVFEEAE